jgi:hypothetical protein
VLVKLVVTLPVLAYTASVILYTVHIFNFLLPNFIVNSSPVVSVWLNWYLTSKYMKKIALKGSLARSHYKARTPHNKEIISPF